MTRSRPHSLPPDRPLRSAASRDVLLARFEHAVAAADGAAGAQCIHELWMRGEIGLNVEPMLERLWTASRGVVPDWLPMRHVAWLPIAYEIAARFARSRRGRSNIYLVLLDYRDSRADPYGIYVGMSRHAPQERFEQHKNGIRAAGSVLQRGLEVLAGPTAHLQGLARTEAAQVEEGLAEALRAAGLFVKGGH